MSLKGFHVLLISLSSLLVAVFGGWSLRAYTTTGDGGQLATAVFSFALSGGLAVYVVWFARKVATRAEQERRGPR